MEYSDINQKITPSSNYLLMANLCNSLYCIIILQGDKVIKIRLVEKRYIKLMVIIAFHLNRSSWSNQKFEN